MSDLTLKAIEDLLDSKLGPINTQLAATPPRPVVTPSAQLASPRILKTAERSRTPRRSLRTNHPEQHYSRERQFEPDGNDHGIVQRKLCAGFAYSYTSDAAAGRIQSIRSH
jgi:hypothetical protein